MKKNNIINFPSSPPKLERQVEAILFAASEPLDIETIEKRVQTQSNIKKVLEMKPKKSNILKNISDVASVRQGKFGPYIFYKTDKMKKPTFISIKNMDL